MRKKLKRIGRSVLTGIAFTGACFGVDADRMSVNGSGQDCGVQALMEPKPKFPGHLWKQGFVSGHATVAVAVDEFGVLTDWLVIEASHRDLVDAVDEVINRWKFSPARVDGVPVYGVDRIKILFDASRFEVPDRRTIPERAMSAGSESSLDFIPKARRRPVKLAEFEELDRIPQAVERPVPRLPKDWLETSLGAEGTFAFFIDTEGRVRMAHLALLEGNVGVDALRAVQKALESWRFEPLTSKGRPVVFQASQPFRFSSFRSLGSKG